MRFGGKVHLEGAKYHSGIEGGVLQGEPNKPQETDNDMVVQMCFLLNVRLLWSIRATKGSARVR